jgi:hypothetical protein
MKHFAVALAVAAAILAACSDDGSDDVTAAASTGTATLTSVATSTSSTTSTLVATTLGAVTTTTTAPTPVCNAPAIHNIGGGIVVTPPANSSLKCESGWRMFAWIGQSGDGILLIQHVSGISWVTDYYGPGCGGVASAPSDELVKSGLPRALADKWGGGCG